MTVTLPIKKRETKTVDLKELIPGIVYGPKQTPVLVVVGRKEFEKLFKTAGESTVIELAGLKDSVSVLVKDVTFAPIKGGIVHVDFYALEKGKEVVTHVPLQFTGESGATKLGAVINRVLHEVTVSCQAADLPAHIEVDSSSLVEVESKLHVSDIKTPKGVKVMESPDVVIAIAEAVVEEPAEPEPVIAAADVPVEQKGKSEETDQSAS